MTAEPATSTPLLNGIAGILQAVAWPTIALVFLLFYRADLGAIIAAVSQKLREATHLKAGQIEIDTEKAIRDEVSKAGADADSQAFEKEIPAGQIRTAQSVGEKLSSAPIAFSQKIDVIYKQVSDLVEEYEKVRREMRGGPTRTHRMNEIAAQMRAISIAARPLLSTLMIGAKHGERLAAICILQVGPELGYFDWLIDEVMEEDQPFVFFHASLAVLELVKTFPYLNTETASRSIQAALDRVTSFRDGPPDQNTIEVLSEALSKLGSAQRGRSFRGPSHI
jgi:hypothetical protein